MKHCTHTKQNACCFFPWLPYDSQQGYVLKTSARFCVFFFLVFISLLHFLLHHHLRNIFYSSHSYFCSPNTHSVRLIPVFQCFVYTFCNLFTFVLFGPYRSFVFLNHTHARLFIGDGSGDDDAAAAAAADIAVIFIYLLVLMCSYLHLQIAQTI